MQHNIDDLKMLSKAIKRLSVALELETNRAMVHDDLTSTQAAILGFIIDNDPEQIYANSIEKEFGLSHPTVSSILKRLQAKGQIEIRQDPADRRFKLITPTGKSLEQVSSHLEIMRSIEQRMLTGVSPEERDLFIALLHKITNNLY